MLGISRVALRERSPQALRDHLEVADAIIVVAIDRLPPVAARGDVVDGSRELDAQRAGHGRQMDEDDRLPATIGPTDENRKT